MSLIRQGRSLPCLLLLACSFMAVTAAAQEKGLSRNALQQMYVDYLRDEGYSPTIDADGDVMFKKEGLIYYIQVDEKDPQFFRIIFPNFWDIEDDEERMQVLRAADYSNALCKVAKVFTVDENVWASIEIFIKTQEDFKAIFKRAMSALKNGVDNFVKKMRE